MYTVVIMESVLFDWQQMIAVNPAREDKKEKQSPTPPSIKMWHTCDISYRINLIYIHICREIHVARIVLCTMFTIYSGIRGRERGDGEAEQGAVGRVQGLHLAR